MPRTSVLSRAGRGAAPAARRAARRAVAADDVAPPNPGAKPVSPWALMRRVTRPEAAALHALSDETLTRAAAARAAGLAPAAFDAALARLHAVVPSLVGRLAGMDPSLLAALAADPDATARAAVSLRLALPARGCDLDSMLARCPGLLAPAEAGGVAAALAALELHYPDPTDVASILAAEPAVLLEDVDRALAELGRLFPDRSAAADLRANPALIFSVGGLRGLSLW